MKLLLASLLVAASTIQNPAVHDPVMAYEDGTYYLYYTGTDIPVMTSTDLKNWNVSADGVLDNKIPAWVRDSVPGFKDQVWAPDVIHYNGKWYMAYACSTFGKNTSTIGLLSNDKLADTKGWKDRGCIISSRAKRDNWNAIDPNFVIDDKGNPWLTWGSFWDGIQLIPLDKSMHVLKGAEPRTIARRFAFNVRDVPESEGGPVRYTPGNYPTGAGQNAIEAPFIYKHDGYYYLFVSWDYCCTGMRSTYRVVVGRSKTVDGPYLDNRGIDMLDGGGVPVIEGDKKTYEAVGHCAVYRFGDKDVFISHGYKIPGGQSELVMRTITWQDGWPVL